MKCMVANSPLSNQSSTKKLTNHSARKTLVKKLKNNNVSKSEIIGITGHTNEAGLDAYDSGDEREQQMMSYAIDNVQKATTFSGMSATNNNWLVPVQQSLLHNPTFKLVNYNYFNKSPKKASSFNFNNCTYGQFLQCSNTKFFSSSISPSPKKAQICCVLVRFFARINNVYCL